MLSKCTNPACSARFLYLHEGKLFKLQTQPEDGRAGSRFEFFWLCTECSRKLTLVFSGGEVSIRFLYEELPEFAGPGAVTRVTSGQERENQDLWETI